jgi:FtsP/CotA-like multicopper oxidase with cupredoxin domain
MDSGQPFYQIGTDGGFHETSVKINEFILLSAERVDVIIDFQNSVVFQRVLHSNYPIRKLHIPFRNE